MMPSFFKKHQFFAFSFSALLFISLLMTDKAVAQQDFDVMGCVRASESTEEMMECGDEYIIYWDDRMQLTLTQLDAILPEARQIMLDESQDAWNEYRVTQVNLSNTIHFGSGDSMNAVLAKIREARLYQQRAEYLEDLINVQQSARSGSGTN